MRSHARANHGGGVVGVVSVGGWAKVLKTLANRNHTANHTNHTGRAPIGAAGAAT